MIGNTVAMPLGPQDDAFNSPIPTGTEGSPEGFFLVRYRMHAKTTLKVYLKLPR